MDPNATLAELVDIARQHLDETDDESRSPHADTPHMAELVLSLHDWLMSGGALPNWWVR